MAKKSFDKAPKPSTQNVVSDTDIDAFERGGVGQDKSTQNHKTTNVGKKENIKTKRLSIDLPEDLHTRFKVVCSANGLKMGKEIEAFIETKCAEME